jgi:RNA polymerase sigma factor (sigma-70 family)
MPVEKSVSLRQLPDHELVALYKTNKDGAIVGILFERHTLMVFGICMKYLRDQDEAQDAVMLIFEKLLDDLLKHEVENFKSWLHSVSRNHCLMFIRSNKAKKEKHKEYEKDAPVVMERSYVLHQEKEIDKEIMLTQLEECLKKLNEQQRVTVDLFFLQEKSYTEVSATTGFSMNEVKSFIQNGKRNLTNCMNEKK